MFAAHSWKNALFDRDPFFQNVSLLLHCEGNGGSQTFTDTSSYNHSMIARNGAAISTSSPIKGTGSALMTNVNDAIVSPYHSSLSLGSGDFTIEISYKSTAHTRGYPVVISNGNFNTNKWQICDRHSSVYPTKFTVNVYNYSPSSPLLVSTTSVSDGVAYDLAITRVAQTIRLFVNGTLEATRTYASSFDAGSGDTLYVGADATQTALTTIDGRVDEVRVTKGVGRYAGNYIPGGFLGS